MTQTEGISRPGSLLVDGRRGQAGRACECASVGRDRRRPDGSDVPVKIVAAAVQMRSELLQRAVNLEVADDLLGRSRTERELARASCRRCSTRGTACFPTSVPAQKERTGRLCDTCRIAAASGEWGLPPGSSRAERPTPLRFAGPLPAGGIDQCLPKKASRLLGGVPFSPRADATGGQDAVGTRRPGDLCRHDGPPGLGRLSRPDRPGGDRIGLARIRVPS